MKLDGYPIVRQEMGEGEDETLDEDDSDDSDVEEACTNQNKED